MNQKVAITVLLTLLVLSICFTATASAAQAQPSFGLPQNDHLQQLTATVTITVGTNIHNNSTVLDQPTRLEIYNYVKANPGVHFRGICDGLGLSVGVVQYHLDVLEHAGFIMSYVDGQNVRYFESGTFSEADMRLISLAKHETTGLILRVLVENDSVLHRDLASAVGISSQALSWQMTQLKQTGLVGAEKVGINVRYILNDAEPVKVVLALISHSGN